VFCATVGAATFFTPPQRDRVSAQAAPPPASQADSRIGSAELMRVVRELASPRYEGRRSGTNGGRAARAFVSKAFAEIGLDRAGTSGFEQPFRLVPSNGRERNSGSPSDAANVVGRVKGTSAATGAIVVSAHYDHLGRDNGRLYPGADDNASGVAALLAIARYIRAHPLGHPVLFVAFDAEELGMYGARAFLARHPQPRRDIALNINLDMVSRNDRNEIVAAGTYHSPWLKPILDDVQRRAAVRILYGYDRPARAGTRDDWTLLSDHAAFHEAGVPFVYFGVEDHPDYHQPTDTAEKINPVFFRNVVDMVLDAVITLDREMARRNEQ
jgi:Zn-dependent M28 family amino/carboxypeptidase